MARGLAVNTLAGDDPRTVAIKTIAAFAAEVVCFGAAEGYQGFAGAFANDNEDDDGKGKSEDKSKTASTLQTDEEHTALVLSLNSIINGIEDDEGGSNKQLLPQNPKILESDFLGKAIPELARCIDYVIEEVGKELGERFKHVHDALESAKDTLGMAAIESYKALREMGESIKDAWNKSILLTADNFERTAAKLYQEKGDGLQPVVLPLVAAVPMALAGLGTIVTGLIIKDKIQEVMTSSESNGPSILSTPLHGGEIQLETFPIPDLSDIGEVPPYVAHPDDFASTRGTGGYGPYADGAVPNILSTPILDTDPNDSILMNRAPELRSGESGAKKDSTVLKKQEKKALLGQNPRVSKHRTSTDLGENADRATAKSISETKQRVRRYLQER